MPKDACRGVLSAVGPTAGASRATIRAPRHAGSAATLAATARVLRALEGAASGLTPAAIALRAGVPKQTSDAVLAALEAEGFVDRLPASRRFCLGSCLLRIAATAGEVTGGGGPAAGAASAAASRIRRVR